MEGKNRVIVASRDQSTPGERRWRDLDTCDDSGGKICTVLCILMHDYNDAEHPGETLESRNGSEFTLGGSLPTTVITPEYQIKRFLFVPKEIGPSRAAANRQATQRNFTATCDSSKCRSAGPKKVT